MRNLSTIVSLFLIVVLVVPVVHADKALAKAGEMIVQLDKGMDVETFVRSQANSMNLKAKKQLSKRLNIWLMTYQEPANARGMAMSAMKTHKAVKAAQANHLVKLRKNRFVPNDFDFEKQWGMNNFGQTKGKVGADINAVNAWSMTTGGQTALGDEIVIAVIDGGFDLAHEDIDFWKNTQEIPDNGVDDDGNGYVDDFDGWNAYDSNGNIPNDSHGTHVAGIAAAKGNNGVGVAGVNWDAKVLPVAGASGTEDIVVEAYAYVLEMRARYNETNGAEGAFIVVTNASFGVDFGDPEEFPVWTAIYDSLGTEGVLNVAATANLNINVDEVGDMPTAVESEFVVAVTNTTDQDLKNRSAAFGVKHIDLGAPGTDVFSTLPGDNYGNLTGTSMATPHVTGAIALLYAGASAELIQMYKQNPPGVALFIRSCLLDGTDPLFDLEGRTATGGRLNLFKSLELLDTRDINAFLTK